MIQIEHDAGEAHQCCGGHGCFRSRDEGEQKVQSERSEWPEHGKGEETGGDALRDQRQEGREKHDGEYLQRLEYGIQCRGPQDAGVDHFDFAEIGIRKKA
jgi:hypothetical protein